MSRIVRIDRVRRILREMRRMLESNPKLLKDPEVKKWLRFAYPLILEYGSLRDKEFFEAIYSELFEEFNQ